MNRSFVFFVAALCGAFFLAGCPPDCIRCADAQTCGRQSGEGWTVSCGGSCGCISNITVRVGYFEPCVPPPGVTRCDCDDLNCETCRTRTLIAGNSCMPHGQGCIGECSYVV